MPCDGETQAWVNPGRQRMFMSGWQSSVIEGSISEPPRGHSSAHLTYTRLDEAALGLRLFPGSKTGQIVGHELQGCKGGPMGGT